MADDSNDSSLGEALVALVLSLGSLFLDGLVARDLWRWFVVPATGFPPIGYWHAMGLSVAAAFWTHQLPYGDAKSGAPRALTLLMLTLALWGVGALIHGAMP